MFRMFGWNALTYPSGRAWSMALSVEPFAIDLAVAGILVRGSGGDEAHDLGAARGSAGTRAISQSFPVKQRMPVDKRSKLPFGGAADRGGG